MAFQIGFMPIRIPGIKIKTNDSCDFCSCSYITAAHQFGSKHISIILKWDNIKQNTDSENNSEDILQPIKITVKLLTHKMISCSKHIYCFFVDCKLSACNDTDVGSSRLLHFPFSCGATLFDGLRVMY